jgi:hypothetical protein
MLWQSRENKMSVKYSQKFLQELINQGEESMLYLQRELASFEVDATPQPKKEDCQ